MVSNFIVQALSGEDITIYGDGGQTRSFCFVDDLIEGLIRLMNNETEVNIFGNSQRVAKHSVGMLTVAMAVDAFTWNCYTSRTEEDMGNSTPSHPLSPPW